MASAVRRALIWIAVPCLLGGCKGMPTPVVSRKVPTAPRGIVLVVDGAGGNQDASLSLVAAVERAGLPLYVRSFDWTHGRGRGVADMTDIDHARAQAYCLAGQICWYRANYPDVPIYVLAYSAGTMVALEANQWLPANSIERLILLAPAVSSNYDLRRALLASRQGVDVFTSERDRFWLGVGTSIVGTADGKRGVPAAGRVGFDAPQLPPNEAALASRLRLHPWDPSVAWTGNSGEHSGSLQSAYLKSYILPLLAAR